MGAAENALSMVGRTPLKLAISMARVHSMALPPEVLANLG